MDHAIINVVANPTVSSDFFMLSSAYFSLQLLTPGAFYTPRAAEFTVKRRRWRNIAACYQQQKSWSY
jgi:hypothetical protein